MAKPEEKLGAWNQSFHGDQKLWKPKDKDENQALGEGSHPQEKAGNRDTKAMRAQRKCEITGSSEGQVKNEDRKRGYSLVGPRKL